ncbi:MAG TPA: hypothetical protein VFB38_08470 [Chthonomonadaceae bacterium]|nr:hypothetical protein [Chthonomonadaceae bacterium]
MKAEIAAFLEKIKSPDADVRYKAWREAGPMGAEAVVPLGELAASPDKGVAKAASGAMETIAHHAARPGAGAEAHAVSVELLKVAQTPHPRMVRADALYLLGFTGDGRIVPGLARLLSDRELREDARMALERIPGSASLSALRQAARTASPDFRPNLEQSLHNRSLTPKTVGREPAR